MISVQDLSGTWKLGWSDGVRNTRSLWDAGIERPTPLLTGTVPGEVHLDLWKSGIIDDPYSGLGCLSSRWVEESWWTYSREFEVASESVSGRSWLVFEGLDYSAVVLLNGVEIGRHNNSFTPLRVEVTGGIKAGTNTVTVHIDSGLYEIGDKPIGGYQSADDQMHHKRQWLRKAQCQFGWDWSTRLINVGITGPVRLEWTQDTVRCDKMVPVAHVSDDLTVGKVTARVFLEGLSTESVTGTLSLEIAETGARSETSITVAPGLHSCESDLEVPQPALWNPVGHGEPNQYTLRYSVTIGGKTIASGERKIGFRKIVFNQTPDADGTGRSFILEVNNKPVFVKGANFVPADMIFANIDAGRYAKLIDLALEANFNMLRIWGGGLYEHDEFYRLCDEKGVLVWQEFIFACGKYPGNDLGFVDNVRAEARYQVRRLAGHPSLIAWCGNNENEMGTWDWDYTTKGTVYSDYGLFHLVLPMIVKEEDPSVYYQPSSPYSLDLAHPNADRTGDQHPWNVGINGYDFRDYRTYRCRFPNEGGFLGSTSLPTMMQSLAKGQEQVGSFSWQQHDNSIAIWASPGVQDEAMRLFLGKSTHELSVKDFTYWAGLLQGEALREYSDNFRRRMFDSASAIFWMYNDCWPATRSWTIVDYNLRRTPSFFPVKRAFATVQVVVVEEEGKVRVFGVNDGSEPMSAQLRYGVFKLSGAYSIDRSADVVLRANASTMLAEFSSEEWTAVDSDRKQTTAFAMLSANGKLVARNRLIGPAFQEMTWSKATPEVKLVGDSAVFSSPVFVWGVCLDLDGDSTLSDNFFDIYPGVDYVIPWMSKATPTILRVGNLAE